MEIKMLDLLGKAETESVRFDEVFSDKDVSWEIPNCLPEDFTVAPVELRFTKGKTGYRYFLAQNSHKEHILYRMKVDK